MREFFHGWRRKAGCVTLVMACVVAGARSRSFSTIDAVSFGHGDTFHTFSSADGKWRWFCTTVDCATEPFCWRQCPIKQLSVEGLWTDFHGISGAGGDMLFSQQSGVTEIRVVPYFPIVVALTLLSTYLILWKPHKRMEPDHA